MIITFAERTPENIDRRAGFFTGNSIIIYIITNFSP